MTEPSRSGGNPGTPGWVKAVGIAALIVAVLVVVVMVTGAGGEHGPGRHAAPSTLEPGEMRQLAWLGGADAGMRGQITVGWRLSSSAEGQRT